MLYCRPEFKMKTFLVACSLILALAGCRRTDVRSFAVDVPQATESDLPALKASLDEAGEVRGYLTIPMALAAHLFVRGE